MSCKSGVRSGLDKPAIKAAERDAERAKAHRLGLLLGEGVDRLEPVFPYKIKAVDTAFFSIPTNPPEQFTSDDA